MPHKSHRRPLCQHHTAAGRRCRMLQSPNHETLCTFHATAEAKLLAQAKMAEANLLAQTKRAEAQSHRSHSIEQVAADLLAGTENLSQPTSVNLFLANLLKNFAHHRISRRDATTLAYISQLLLNSQSVIHRQAKDAQAATAQAAANEPQRIVIDMPRPCHRPHLDDPPPSRCSGGSSDPFLSPTGFPNSPNPSPTPHICSGESSDSHPAKSPSDATPKTCHPVYPAEGSERSEESAFPAPSTESSARVPATPVASSPQTLAPPNANKVLYTPDDDSAPSHHPVPTRRHPRVYGFIPLRHHRNLKMAPSRSSNHSPLRQPRNACIVNHFYSSASLAKRGPSQHGDRGNGASTNHRLRSA